MDFGDLASLQIEGRVINKYKKAETEFALLPFKLAENEVPLWTRQGSRKWEQGVLLLTDQRIAFLPRSAEKHRFEVPLAELRDIDLQPFKWGAARYTAAAGVSMATANPLPLIGARLASRVWEKQLCINTTYGKTMRYDTFIGYGLGEVRDELHENLQELHKAKKNPDALKQLHSQSESELNRSSGGAKSGAKVRSAPEGLSAGHAKAYEKGVNAARQRRPRESPYSDHESPYHESWLRGFDKQRELSEVGHVPVEFSKTEHIQAYKGGALAARHDDARNPSHQNPLHQELWLQGFDKERLLNNFGSSYEKGRKAALTGKSWSDCGYTSNMYKNSWYEGFEDQLKDSKLGEPLPKVPGDLSKMFEKVLFREGALAAREGKPESANPGEKPTQEEAWTLGYRTEQKHSEDTERMVTDFPDQSFFDDAVDGGAEADINAGNGPFETPKTVDLRSNTESKPASEPEPRVTVASEEAVRDHLSYSLDTPKHKRFFEQGCQAAINGESWSDCPYSSPLPRSIWYDGYDAETRASRLSIPLPEVPEDLRTSSKRVMFREGTISARNNGAEEDIPQSSTAEQSAWRRGFHAEQSRIASPEKTAEQAKEESDKETELREVAGETTSKLSGEYYSEDRWQNWIDQIKAKTVDPQNKDSAHIFFSLQDDVIAAVTEIITNYPKANNDKYSTLSELVSFHKMVVDEVQFDTREKAGLFGATQMSLLSVFFAAEAYVSQGVAEDASANEYILKAEDAEIAGDRVTALSLVAAAGTRIIAGDELSVLPTEGLKRRPIARWVDGLYCLQNTIAELDASDEEVTADGAQSIGHPVELPAETKNALPSLPYSLEDPQRRAVYESGRQAALNRESWFECPHSSSFPKSIWYDGYDAETRISDLGPSLPRVPEDLHKPPRRIMFREGALAARNGELETNNPASVTTAERTTWIRGFNAEIAEGLERGAQNAHLLIQLISEELNHKRGSKNQAPQ